MKKLLLLVLSTMFLSSLVTPAFGAALVNENFDYALGNLAGNGDWVSTSATATDPIQVTDNPLVYPEYQPTAIGKSIFIGNYGVGTSEKVRMAFADINTGSAYYSMLVNFSSVPDYTGSSAAYFASFNKGTGTAAGTDYGFLVAKQGSSEGKIQFGVSKNTASLTSSSAKVEFASTEFDLNTTYLLVVKYELNDGSGTTVSLWVNPVIGTTTPTPLVVASYSVATTNVNRIMIRQGATASAAAPQGTIDALRVASSWADLFGKAPVDEPSITVAPTVNLGTLFPGDTKSQILNVKGLNLKQDIVLSGLSGDLSVSPTTITKEEAMAVGGKDVTLSLTAATQGNNSQTLVLTSATLSKSSVISWYVTPITVVDNLEALRSQDPDGSTLYQVSADVIVSLPFVNTNSQKCLFVQDATRGLSIIDAATPVLTTSYAEGDKINRIVGTLNSSFGTLTFTPSKDFGTPISQGNELTPIETTIANIKSDATLHGMLVTIKGITFANAGGTFTTNEDFSKEGATGKMRLVAEDIKDQTIPFLADLTGVVSASSSALVAPRGWKDIEDLTIGLESSTIESKVWVSGSSIFVHQGSEEKITLFDISGAVIASVYGKEFSFSVAQKGLYLIRTADKTVKVTVQ